MLDLQHANFFVLLHFVSTFLGLSKFHREPLPQTIPIGGAARFECQIEGVPTPTITWEKDRVAVPEEARSALCIVCIVFEFVDSVVVYLLVGLRQSLSNKRLPVCCSKRRHLIK